MKELERVAFSGYGKALHISSVHRISTFYSQFHAAVKWLYGLNNYAVTS